jgi:hypothetical protein
MASIYPTTVPSKRLSESITGASTSFKLNSITGWDGNALTSADFGSVAFAVFRNSANTLMEIMEIDPTTVTSASSPITINKRGLKFTGDLTTQVAGNKLTWVKGDTIVELGTHVPQLLKSFVDVYADQTVAGVKTFSSPPVVPTPVGNTDAANKSYVDGVAIAGAPDASTTTKGIVEEAVESEIEAGTAAGGTSARLFVNPSTLKTSDYGTKIYNRYGDYAADAGANDTYVITLSPVPTAYTTGMEISFKPNTGNTGAATINVNSLGAQTIKKGGTTDLSDGDLIAGRVYELVYDGTNFQVKDVATLSKKVSQNGSEIYAADAGANDTYAVTLSPAPTAYTTGMVVRFKANTVNTGAATLNVNSLGATSVLRTDGSALADGDIAANQIVEVIYDGTNFRMVSPTANSPKFAQGYTTRTIDTSSGNLVIAHGLGRSPRRVGIVSKLNASSAAGGGVDIDFGVYDGTNTASTKGTGSIISLTGAGASPNSQSATITVDATNITLAFTKSGSNGTETIHIVWTAEA